MPKIVKPSYTLHKPTRQARVRIRGKDHYLGEYGSPESRERYETLMTEWFAGQGDVSRVTVSIDDVALLFLEFAAGYYRKSDKPTSELNNIRIALRPLLRLFGQIADRGVQADRPPRRPQ